MLAGRLCSRSAGEIHCWRSPELNPPSMLTRLVLAVQRCARRAGYSDGELVLTKQPKDGRRQCPGFTGLQFIATP